MKKLIYLPLLFTTVFIYAQIRGNATDTNTLNFSDLGSAAIHGNEVRDFGQQSLTPNSIITLDVKALSNVLAGLIVKFSTVVIPINLIKGRPTTTDEEPVIANTIKIRINSQR